MFVPVMSERAPLVTRALMLRFVSIVGASASFFLLLPVVPLYAGASGGGGRTAGLATGALMLSTVVGELAAPASSPATATARRSRRGSSCSAHPPSY